MSEEQREKYFAFLDGLRESGDVNMFAAAGPLRQVFPELSRSEAREVLVDWMETYAERHQA